MTIRKGIEPEAVLWKFTKTYKSYRWKTEGDEQVREAYEYTTYYAIVLETRRARTRGYEVDPELKPFLEQLRIRLTPVFVGQHGVREVARYRAIGTRLRHLSEEDYHNLTIDETASKWYQRVHNSHLRPFLTAYEDAYSPQLLADMHQELDGTLPPDVEWPVEPNMPEQNQNINRWASFSQW